MKKLVYFFLKALPFTAGLILSLTAISFLVNFTDNMEEEGFIIFVLLCILGIPMLLFGIKMLSN